MNCATNYDLKIKTRIKLVHIAASELGLLDPKRHNTDPDDDYHRILARWNRPGTRQPVTSSVQMSYEQLGELLEFFEGLGFKLKSKGSNGLNGCNGSSGLNKKPQWKKYDSSLDGLKTEICDLAKERFGEAWELPLNNFCARFGVRHWKWLDVSHGKEVKGALLRLRRQATAEDPSAGSGQAPRGEEEVPL